MGSFMKYLFFSVVLIPFLAFATGGVDGGGGKSVVCRDKAGDIVTAELLDLYEGRVQYGLVIESSSDSVLVQMENAIKRIAKGRGLKFQEVVLFAGDYVNTNKTILPAGTGLRSVNDSHHVIIPKDCRVEQLAHFTSQNQILIDGEIWNKLDDTNKAALLVHEALYKEFRNYGAKNSLRVRSYVAYAFAGIETINIREDIPEDAYICRTYSKNSRNLLSETYFWAYNDESGELIFQFDSIGSDLILTKSQVSIDKIRVSDLDRVKSSTYWLKLFSLFSGAYYESNVGIVISFEQKEIDGVFKMVKKIGQENMPDTVDSLFECGPQK